MNPYSKKTVSGFTLVELLIVVIILAILAAIVVPQFASSTNDAKVSALDSTLANMRAAIDLYYQQHGDYPAAKTAVATNCPAGATPGSGTGGDEATFLEQLAWYTDSDGKACSIKDATYKYGPYIKKKVVPDNPVTGKNALAFAATPGNLNMAADGQNLGWKYDTKTGKFIANDTNLDPNNDPYSSH